MLYYFFVINIVALILTVVDKHNARVGKWRVKENTLLLYAILGGSVTMYLTMRIIRHKTLHNKFMLGLPLIIALQIIVFLFFEQKFPQFF